MDVKRLYVDINIYNNFKYDVIYGNVAYCCKIIK